mmetsp:Transcript_16025/g.26639  ORF Transcript_16025/g.26639 Transcript_16025/m.26639 type:complete len:128 (-) Transcript_16025:845-1228(-)
MNFVLLLLLLLLQGQVNTPWHNTPWQQVYVSTAAMPNQHMECLLMPGRSVLTPRSPSVQLRAQPSAHHPLAFVRAAAAAQTVLQELLSVLLAWAAIAPQASAVQSAASRCLESVREHLFHEGRSSEL